MNYFLVYLILMLDTWKAAFIALIIICSIILIIVIITWFMSDDGVYASESEKESDKILTKKIGKIAFITLIISFVFVIFCPTTKQVATIYLLPKITSNKSMQELPSKTAELLLIEVKKEINTINALPSNIEIKKN